jgi:glucan-binding YG repeat protein
MPVAACCKKAQQLAKKHKKGGSASGSKVPILLWCGAAQNKIGGNLMKAGKRFLSLALVFLICLSLLPMGALASGEGASEEIEISQEPAEETEILDGLSDEEAPAEAEEPFQVEESAAAEEEPAEAKETAAVEEPVAEEEEPALDGAATSGRCGNNLTWKYSSGTLAISGTGAMWEYDEYPNFDYTNIMGDASNWYPWSSYATAIKKVVVGEGVTSISGNAFNLCASLSSVSLPSSLTSIGISAFSCCTSLTSITIPSHVTTIREYAFVTTGLTSVTIPASVTTIGERVFENCTQLTSIQVDSGNAHYSSVDGVLFNKAKTKLIQYPEGRTNSFYSVPSGVSTIGEGAFMNHKYLTKVTLPSGVTTIERWAFENCEQLVSINIPNGVTTIGVCAFCYSSALSSITLPASVTTIGTEAFYACDSLTSLTILSSTCTITQKASDAKYGFYTLGVPGTTTIYGVSGSTAQSYAKQYGFTFKTAQVTVTGWQQKNGKWYYYDSTGSAVTGEKKLSGKWYYFDANGVMQTGWKQWAGKWYYYDLKSGAMRQGAWLSAGGNWYYFDDTGAMVTGWKQVGGTWFYFASGGAMTTGWKQLSGKWYYFDLKSGAMRQSAWLSTTNGNWYYFDGNGVMLASTTRKIDGTTYTFDASGRML